MLEDQLQEQNPRTENYQQTIATRITLITFALMLMVAIVNAFFVPNQDKTPIDNYTMPFIALSAGLSYYLARKGAHIRGIYILLGSIALIALIYPFAANNVGWQTAIGTLVITTSIANSTLTSKTAGRISAAAFLLAIIIILLELFVNGVTQIPVTTSSIVITGVLSVIYAGIILSRFRMFSLRTKLITAFVAVSIISVGAVAFTISRSLLAQLTAKVEQELAGVARLTASSIADELDKQVDLLRILSLSGTLDEELIEISAAPTKSQSELEQLDRQWQAADAAENDADPLVRSVLNHGISQELRELQNQFPEHMEVFVTDKYGVSIAASDRITDYYQADEEWWKTVYNNGQGNVFMGQPEFDERNQRLVMLIAVPVFDSTTNNLVGVLGTTVNFAVFIPAFEAGQVGQTGRTEIYLAGGTELELEKESDGEFKLKLEEAAADLAAALQQSKGFLETTHNGISVLAAQACYLESMTIPKMWQHWSASTGV